MPKITIKAIVQEVSTPEIVGKNNTLMQKIILLEPGYVDTFGEKKGTDNLWEAALFNDKINKMGLGAQHLQSKVEATLYLDSRKVVRNGGIENYIINANLGDIKFI